MSGGGGGGGVGGGGLLNDPLEIALIAGTAIAAPYAAPLLFEGGALAGSTMLGAGVAGAGIGGLGNMLIGRDPVQGALYGGLGGAAAGAAGVNAGAGGPQLVDAVSGPISGVGAAGAGPTVAGAGTSLIPGISNTALGVGAGGLGLMALMKQDQAKYGTPTAAQTTYTGGALQDFHYDPHNYTPLVPTPPNPVYQAQYQDRVNPASTVTPMTPYRPVMAASGGLMQDKDFTAGGMYPGSQIDKTQYTSSPQTPMSMQATMADYDPATNPLTGEPTTHMADGGAVNANTNAPQVYQPQYANYASPDTRAAALNYFQMPIDAAQLGNRYSAGSYTPPATGLYGIPTAVANGLANQVAQQGLGAIPTPTRAPMDSGNTYNPMLIPHNPMWQAEQDRQAAEAAAAQAAADAEAHKGMHQGFAGQWYTDTPPDNSGGGGAAGGLMPRDLRYAAGGLASLGSYSDGGQMLKGPGDGMSDSIPAKIGRAQPARLADSEFVVPADVVSHLGNGSSDAGAKKLYSMMAQVRKARTGKKKQAPKINASRYLPA
jgi:hypothetical protein